MLTRLSDHEEYFIVKQVISSNCGEPYDSPIIRGVIDSLFKELDYPAIDLEYRTVAIPIDEYYKHVRSQLYRVNLYDDHFYLGSLRIEHLKKAIEYSKIQEVYSNENYEIFKRYVIIKTKYEK